MEPLRHPVELGAQDALCLSEFDSMSSGTMMHADGRENAFRRRADLPLSEDVHS